MELIEEQLATLSDELIEQQHNLLLALGRRFIPTLTLEDLLQPNDYPELEGSPEFRYEEGVLAGLLTYRMALLAKLRH